MRTLSASRVAAILGISSSRVRRIARARKLGRCVADLVWVFSPADVEAMRERHPGHPKKSLKKEAETS